MALALVVLVALGAGTAGAVEGPGFAEVAAGEPDPAEVAGEPRSAEVAAEQPTLAEVAAAIPTPSCAEGPQRDGKVIVGTECADRIVVPPAVSYVDGGPGNDLILGSLTTAASCEAGCHLGVGSQTIEGGEGDDIIYGDRGNDILRGNGGDDRLYGGIGDDRIEGGPGNDWMSGGFGADTIDGGEGNDYVRGDGTIDHIFDTGGGYDTLSFATGVTPGFGAGIDTGVSGFPETKEGERGVYLNLGAGGEDANDGIAASAGGVDVVQPDVFERIIGTPFSDYIVGTGLSEEIIGGGGADVIEGGGGTDTLRGGADGDYLEAAAGSTLVGGPGTDGCVGAGTNQSECDGTAKAVHLRDDTTVSVGETDAGSGSTDVYLVGSISGDSVNATYVAGSPGSVSFTLSAGSFDTEASDAGGCAIADATHATCLLGSPITPNVPALDAILLAGMGGTDTIAASNFPDGTSVIELGGAGADTLNGGPSEDVLVDDPPENPSADTLNAGAGDDALFHNGGADVLEGGEGSDLFLSVSVCDGETLKGGPSVGSDRDNASWARLGGGGVYANLEDGVVGRVDGEAPTCPGEDFDHMEGIEDLEGSEGNDVLYGNEEANQLLGHKGEDTYRALGGDDTIFANSGSRDKVIDCGEGTADAAVIDLASIGDPAPIGCESVREGSPNEFQEEIELPLPVTPPPPSPTQTPTTPAPTPKPTKPKSDRTPPRTKLLRRPAALLSVAPRHRAVVVIRFAASERSHFECKLDSRPYRACRSPLRVRLAAGRHTFRVFAIDAAGNRDPTPALLRLHVVTRR